jgi:hypothetical protein
MLAIVLLVQQLEGHILQPLVMGKAVSLHPVAVILSVAAGSYLAGIPGALFSVPILAVANSAVRYIAARTWEHEQVPVIAGKPITAGAGGDNTIKDVEPASASGAGRDVASGTPAEHRDARTSSPEGTGAEPRGE